MSIRIRVIIFEGGRLSGDGIDGGRDDDDDDDREARSCPSREIITI